MTTSERVTLEALDIASYQGSGLLDEDRMSASMVRAVPRLQRMSLARHEGAGLWRITLAGVATLRGAHTPPALPVETIRDRCLTFIRTHPRATPERIAEGIGVPNRNIRHSLIHLVKAGDVRRAGRGLTGDPYRYSLSSDDSEVAA